MTNSKNSSKKSFILGMNNNTSDMFSKVYIFSRTCISKNLSHITYFNYNKN